MQTGREEKPCEDREKTAISLVSLRERPQKKSALSIP